MSKGYEFPQEFGSDGEELILYRVEYVNEWYVWAKDSADAMAAAVNVFQKSPEGYWVADSVPGEDIADYAPNAYLAESWL